MNKSLLILLLLNIYHSEILLAQWTKKDSLWLDNVLSGKEEIRLKPEVQKAIEMGTFLNIENPFPELISSPAQLPIIRIFQNISHQNTICEKIDYTQIPPCIFMKYFGPKPLLQKELSSFNMAGIDLMSPYNIAPKPNFNTDPLNNKIMYPAEISLNTIHYIWRIFHEK